jgi:hypothetical protein
MLGKLTTRLQGTWLDSLILDINSSTVIQSVAVECKPGHQKKNGKRTRFGKFFNVGKNNKEGEIPMTEIIEEKKRIDMLFVKRSISELVDSLYSNASFNKLGLDYNNGSIFLWIEIKDKDQKNNDKIKSIISAANQKYHASGLKVNHIVVEEFLGLEIPPDYKEVKR